MKFGEQPTYSRQAYEDTEKGIQDVKDIAQGSDSVEDLRTLVQEKKGLEAQKAELHGQAWDEANEMNKEHDALAQESAAQAETDAAEVARIRAEILGESAVSEVVSVETVPMTAEAAPVQGSNSDKSSSRNVPVPIFDAPSLEGGPNATEYTGKAIKEVSGGLIEYVPGTQQRLERGELTGYVFEGKDTIPAERLPELKSMLAQAEQRKSAEAFDYVRLPDSARGAEDTRNLSLDDRKGFEVALSVKKSANEETRKKILVSSFATGAATMSTGIGAAALGYSTAGLGLMLGVTPAILGAGALAYGGKKIYDWYKQRKATKNFMAASVARQANQSI